jgi:uncharacterized iron-regulated membrane protein
VYIFLISATGALLMFRSDIQRAGAPQFFEVANSRPPADIATVADNFRRAYPGQSIAGIDTPRPQRQTFLTYVLKDERYVAAFAHPVTGEVLGELSPWSFVSRLQDLHFELLAGNTGRVVNGAGGLCLAVLALTGVVVWWPAAGAWRRALRVNFRGSWRRFIFDSHRAIGICTAILVFIWGFSGWYFVFPRPMRAIVGLFSPLSTAPRVISVPDEGRHAQSIATFVDKAQASSPASELIRVLLPTSEGAPVIVTMTHAGMSRSLDETGVSFYFDQYSGALLQRWDGSPRTAGDRMISLLTILHMGLFGGPIVKMLWAVLAVAPALLFVTGALMWWSRFLRGRLARTGGRIPPPRARRAAAGVATMLGLAASAAAQNSQTISPGSVVQVSQSGRGAYEASLAPFGGGFAAAWYDTRDGHGEIYVRLLDRDGRPVGPEKRITSGSSSAYEPDIWPLEDGFVVVWYEGASDGTTTAKLGVWNADMTARWTRSLSTVGRRGRNPVVRAAGGKTFVAWIEDDANGSPAVWGEWVNVSGPGSRPMRLAPAGNTTWNINLAIDDRGRAWVVFDAPVPSGQNELFLSRVNGSRVDAIRLTADDGFDSRYPDLAFNGDRAALTWFDERDGNQEVYLFVAPIAALKEGLEQRAIRVTDTPGESIGAYLSWSKGQLGLAWCDNSNGKQHELFMQLFEPDGRPLGAPVQLTRTPTWSLIPAIRPTPTGFALAWNEFEPSALGVHADGRSEVMFIVVSTLGASRARR